MKVKVICERCGKETEFTPETKGNLCHVGNKLRKDSWLSISLSHNKSYSVSPYDDLINKLSKETDETKIREMIEDVDDLDIDSEVKTEIEFRCEHCDNTITLYEING